MKWLAIYRLLSPYFFRRRLLVFVLAALMATGQLLQGGARPAAAAATNASTSTPAVIAANDPILDPSLFFNYAPPPLLNIYDLELFISGKTVSIDRGGAFAATDAQEASLLKLEDQAIKNVLALHGLPASDYRAVQSWGRTEALAQLWALLSVAIDASPRTADQQNAVDWLAAIAKNQAIAAAESAGLEYVQWAGRSESGYWDLLENIIVTKDAIETFLEGNQVPQPYNHTNLDLADGGYCLYRAPAPYASEYTGYNHPTCFTPCSSFLGCSPPTPSYDSLVKWGQAASSYASLNSAQFARTAQNIGIALGISAAVAAAVVAGSVVPAAMISAAGLATAVAVAVETAAEAGAVLVPSLLSPFTGAIAGLSAVAGVAAIVIAAIVIAVVEGINVVNATKLPGQLGELIYNARNTAQDPKTLKASTTGLTSLFAIFVGASMPEPTNESCDNSGQTPPPGVEVRGSLVLFPREAPCLNPTPIHEVAPSDPKFLVQEQTAAIPTVSQTISWKDPSTGAASTAAFTNNWFVIDSNGSRRQALKISYTDWDDEDQSAWLLHDATHGYVFVSYSVPAVGATADLTDAGKDTIKYVGSDGKNYTAKVKVQAMPTGTPKVTSKAIEGQPVTFDANNFAPGDAVYPVTYLWRFEKEDCHVTTATCLTGNLIDLSFGEAVQGDKPWNVWQAAGAMHAEVTATDATGATATTRLIVMVSNEAPILSPLDSNAVAGPVKVGTDVGVTAHFDDVGDQSRLQASIDWGDGTSEPARCISHVFMACGFVFDSSAIVLSNDPVTVGANTLDFKFAATHRYAAGTYKAKVTVWDQGGATVSRTFDVKVEKYAQPINFLGHQDQTYGDGPTGVVATPLTLNGNLTFAVTGDPSVCAITSQGLHPIVDVFVADVAILAAGECEIAASQPGSDLLDPGLATRSFTVHPAPLTITASSATITYGDTMPAVTPGYDGFVNGDDPSDLDAAPVCQSSAPGDGTGGAYETTCAGGADANYAIETVTGILWIQSAATGLGLAKENTTTPVTGEPVTFTATVSGQVPGMAAPGGSVTFLIGNEVIAGCESRPVELGAASCTTSSLGVGSHQVRAIYTGDTNYESSLSTDVSTTIDKAATTVALAGGPATVTGESITFRAMVAVKSPGSGDPNGTVAFTDGGTTIAACDAQPVDPSSGVATCTVRLAAGNHSIGAAYSGDQSYLGSNASAIAASVAKAGTSTSIAASASPSIKGKAVTFTADHRRRRAGLGHPDRSGHLLRRHDPPRDRSAEHR